MFKHALILAAGKGERMLPLTKYVPKALIEINGIPLINHVIHSLSIENYIDNIHITYGHLGVKLLHNVFDSQTLINTKGKGNAWVLFNTLIKYINEPIVVVPCDIIFKIDFKNIFNEYKVMGEPACCLVPIEPRDGVDGDFIFSEKNIVSELSRTKKSFIYASGIQVLNPAKINSMVQPKDNFNDVWNELIKIHQLQVFSNFNSHPNKWLAFDKIEQINNG